MIQHGYRDPIHAFATFFTIVVFLGLSAGSDCTQARDNRPKLTIGSKAPKIDIEHWMSMPDGFTKVQRFKKGNVYVVEFWATWCGPCLRAMPHISDIAQEYAEQGVQVIGVSDEKLSKVEAFLKKKPKKDKPETWADITSKYCLTCDPDGSVKKSIFRAAGQTGIPRAFIIGETGHVEWIGHPTRIDEPLEQVVAGTWDRAAFKKSFERSYRIKKNKKAFDKLLKEKKYNLAVVQIGRILKDYDEGESMKQWHAKQLKICLTNNLRRSEKDFKKIAAKYYKDPVMMNRMAWTVVEAHQNDADIEPEVLKLAKQAIDLSVKENRSAAALDTLAHVLEMQGEVTEAIKIQTEAVENAEEKLKPDLEKYLSDLKAKDKET